MKKLLFGFITLGSISVFAVDLPKQCSISLRTKAYIQQKENHGHKMDIVHIFGDAAKDIYAEITGDETWVTENGKEYVIKSQGNINCFREDRTKKGEVCAIYECEI